MLVLERREGDRVVVPAVRLEIEVREIRGGYVKLGFRCPNDVDIFRHEVWARMSFDQWDTGVSGVETQDMEDQK